MNLDICCNVFQMGEISTDRQKQRLKTLLVDETMYILTLYRDQVKMKRDH